MLARTRAWDWAVVGVVVLWSAVLVVTTGCGVVPETVATTSAVVTTGHPATSVIKAAPLPDPPEAYAWLASLPRGERWTPADEGYRRDAFGRAWADTDANGCNQRDDVLLRDGVPGTVRVVTQGACDHDVVAGAWSDPYTGRALRFDDLKDPVQARGVQIDHVVPLAEAWVSGAQSWTPERRTAFANDLDVLLAVDGSANQSKGDGDPAAWRPRRAFQCTYALRWISVKSTWGLAVDTSEHDALLELLATCSR